MHWVGTVSLNSRHIEGQFSPNATDSLALAVAVGTRQCDPLRGNKSHSTKGFAPMVFISFLSIIPFPCAM